MINNSCIMGCSAPSDIVFEGQDLLNNGPGFFKVLKCCQCGLMRTSPQPSTEEISQYYPETYSCYQGTKPIKISNSNKLILFAKKIHRRCFNFQTDYIPEMPVGSMLEIGCATGGFMLQMENKGWQVEGLEFSPYAVTLAKSQGLNVECSAIEKSNRQTRQYDLIVGWMVLEHLHDPALALQKMKSWLKPTGKLVISVPNSASLDFKIFKQYGYALQLPTHLFHYTPQTIRFLLNRNGWQVLEVVHQRILSNYLGGLGLLLRAKGFSRLGNYFLHRCREPGKWRYVLYPLAWLMSHFGQTGRMIIVARPQP